MVSWWEAANSLGFWVCGVFLVALALYQAYYFTRKAYKVSTKIGLKREQLNRGFRTGVISTLGPACAIVIGMVGIMVTLGSAIAFQREGAGVGSIMYELMVSSIGAEAAGTRLGAPDFNMDALAAAVFAMNTGCLGWIIVALLGTGPLKGKLLKLGRRDPTLLAVITSCAMMGAFGAFTAGYILPLRPDIFAVIVGAVVAVALTKISDIIKKPLLKEFVMGVSMLIAMFLTALIFGG